jgi:serine protease AprX
MTKILKVYAGKDEVAAISESVKVIETYEAFTVVEADEEQAKALAKKYPVEDMTAQYDLKLGGQTVDTSKPRITAEGTTRPHAAYKGVRQPGPGPHHYVVQFVGPIKKNWLSRVRATGAKLREPMGDFSYIVRATESMLPKIAALSCVRWLGHLPYRDRIAAHLRGDETGPKLARRRERPGVLTVESFTSEDVAPIATAARSLGFQVIAKEPKANLLLVQSKESASGMQK